LHGTYLHPGRGFSTIHRGPGGDFTDYDALRAGWEILRGELLPKWIAEHPGTRPYAWWLFDAPERRQRTDGVQHPFDNRVRRQRIEAAGEGLKKTGYELYYGRPRALVVKDDFEAEYESEMAYLMRLDLLTDAERRELL
jgi:hypothetical protein